jgi:putative acetyltransferase
MGTRWHTDRRPRHVPVTPDRQTGAVHIARADFTDPRLAAFLQAHLDDIEPTAPPESRHALDLTALQGDGVRLWVATDAHGIVGTVALAAVDDGHEELKSMRTEPRVRGTGVATRLLAELAWAAIERGCEALTLEVRASNTGAQALYRRFGFAPVGVRQKYYENTEDAIVMWCHDIGDDAYRARLAELSPEAARDRA